MRVVSPLLYGAFVVAGLVVLGASAGVTVLVNQEGSFSMGQLVALFFCGIFLASAMGAQMYRRDLAGSVLVSALSGGLALLAFFGVPFWLLTYYGFEAPSPRVMGTFLLVVPLVAFGLSGAGAMFLVEGVKRYRSRFGMLHAPR